MNQGPRWILLIKKRRWKISRYCPFKIRISPSSSPNRVFRKCSKLIPYAYSYLPTKCNETITFPFLRLWGQLPALCVWEQELPGEVATTHQQLINSLSTSDQQLFNVPQPINCACDYGQNIVDETVTGTRKLRGLFQKMEIVRTVWQVIDIHCFSNVWLILKVLLVPSGNSPREHYMYICICSQ